MVASGASKLTLKGNIMPEINLVRLGHYHVPSGGTDDLGDRTEGWTSAASGSCRTALVVDNRNDEGIGIVFWNYNGGMENRHLVVVGPPDEKQDTFHLSADCPWKR